MQSTVAQKNQQGAQRPKQCEDGGEYPEFHLERLSIEVSRLVECERETEEGNEAQKVSDSERDKNGSHVRYSTTASGSPAFPASTKPIS